MPFALFLLALLLTPPAAHAAPVLTEPHPFAVRLAVATHQGEVARVVEGCGVTSSRSGGFVIPRRRGPALYGLLCDAASGALRLRIFAAADLSLLFDHQGGPGLTVRLLPQGLQVSEGEDNLIWDAPDGEFGSPRFLAANGEASGLRLTSGEVLPPRLRPHDHVLARDPLEPLRLGPAPDAPFFARASTHLLVHLRDEETAFWRAGGFARVCIPDGGCGYVPENQLLPVDGLDDDAEAVALMRAAFGAPSPEFGCWPRPGNTDGVLVCLRPHKLFRSVGPGGQTRVLVVGGMGFSPGGPLSRCHACAAGFGLVVADSRGVRAMPVHAIGSWGRGPAVENIALVGAESANWHIVARESFNHHGAIVSRHHLFGMIGDAPAWLGTMPGEVTRIVEAASGLFVEDRGGVRLLWDTRPGGVAPRLVPLNGEGAPLTPRRDPASGRYPRVEAP